MKKTSNAEKPNAASTPLAERLYPEALAEKEAELIKARRAKNSHLPKSETAKNPRQAVRESVGLAFSGGGIRSATFCLGVAQHLARCGWLGYFDILSTVSGGGYLGSFLGKLIQESKSVPVAESRIKDSQSWPVHWLRENGYYLTPGSGADYWVILALLLRNWVAVQVVLGGTVIIAFMVGALLRCYLWNWAGWREWETMYFLNFSSGHFGVSPWFIPAAAVAAVGVVVPGLVYWATQLLPDERARDGAQSLLTRCAAFGLLITCGLGLIGIMDTAAAATYHWLKLPESAGMRVAAIYGACVAGFGFLQKFAGKLTKLTKMVGKGQAPMSPLLLAGAAGYLWALLFLFGLAIIGQYFLFDNQQIPNSALDLANMGNHWPMMLGITCVYTAIVWVMSRVYGFVNLSSLHQYYSTRLCRAYLGASNVEREKDVIPVTQPHPSDDLFWDRYAPEDSGGPLHVLNCTLNETVSGKSQIERIDRKGLAFAMGPAGLTVSSEHHALWDGSAEDAGHTRKIVAIDNGKDFQVFPHQIHGEGPAASYDVENLTVGDWIGISGAAFSTGMGANTNAGLSLLMGFGNIRLGYWWDSGIKPGYRDKTGPAVGGEAQAPTGAALPQALTEPTRRPRADQLLKRLFSKLFPAPASLLDEVLTQYHGPARRRWYLSDGGHFENTACYELLRRRVRFILCVDCGQDEDYAFEDVANLVRKARIDFDAEVKFLGGDKLRKAVASLPPPFNRLDWKQIGEPKDFHASKAEKGSGITTTGSCHALLAQVKFAGPSGPDRKGDKSHILFLKPSLSGDESEDVAEYHRMRSAFPQESTADQFYNESQWESYRALGVHVAENVLGSEPDAEPPAATPRKATAKAAKVS